MNSPKKGGAYVAPPLQHPEDLLERAYAAIPEHYETLRMDIRLYLLKASPQAVL